MNAIERFGVGLFGLLFLAGGVVLAFTDDPLYIFLSVMSLAAVARFAVPFS